MSCRILVVDDDPTIRTSLREAFIEEGFEVVVAGDGVQALSFIGQAAPDIVLSDVRMPEIDGMSLLRLVKARSPETDVVLMTAFDDMSTVVAAMRDGAVEFLVKPIELGELRLVIRRVLEDRQARQRSKRAIPAELSLEGIIGHTPAMINIFKTIGQAAAARAAVLVRGESGTGKELVARAIHMSSTTAAEPFVPVNCAAIPSTLLESELFGHVRGAFTGAIAARRGRFAMAGEGTVFLDEIGDTSLDFQSKLLRVLQDREFQPVGAEVVEHTAARVIAATHQNLETMVSEGRFREDLYYRLRVVEIVIPALRERRADILLLATHMVRRAALSLKMAEPILSNEAKDRLAAHDWPGNVRELENCITHAVVIASGSVIRAEHLSLASPRSATPSRVASLEELEREHVVRVLAVTEGHKTRAAELLGVSRPRLNRLLEKYGLS